MLSEKISEKATIKSPISWVGGKFMLADKIVRLFPEHTLYVEVFGGAAHVLFKKPPSTTEIYNDINRDLVCFFQTVKDKEKCGILYEMLDSTPYSRDVFDLCLSVVNNHEFDEVKFPYASDIYRAYCFAVVNKQSFGALGESWGVQVENIDNGRIAATFNNIKYRLSAACDRLKYVQIEKNDFRYILKRYDRANTLFYLDPPYTFDMRSAGKQYKHEMEEADHIELVDMLLNLQGKAVLSGYDTPLYNRLCEAGWSKISLGERNIDICNPGGKPRLKKQEFVWCNF